LPTLVLHGSCFNGHRLPQNDFLAYLYEVEKRKKKHHWLNFSGMLPGAPTTFVATRAEPALMALNHHWTT